MTKQEFEFGFAAATDFNPSPDAVMELLACIGREPVRLRDLALDLFGAGAKCEAVYPLLTEANKLGDWMLGTANARGGRVVECVRGYMDMRRACVAYWRDRTTDPARA